MVLLLALGLAHAIEVNDQLSLSLEGGEVVDGWFIRAEQGDVVLHVPALGRTAVVPLSIVHEVTCNDEPWALERFAAEIDSARAAYEAWRLDPPPHPAPGWVALPSVFLAGSGHAALGEWKFARGLMIVDALVMSVAVAEILGQQRKQVFFTASAGAIIVKTYAVSDVIRRSRSRRRRLGIGRSALENSGS